MINSYSIIYLRKVKSNIFKKIKPLKIKSFAAVITSTVQSYTEHPMHRDGRRLMVARKLAWDTSHFLRGLFVSLKVGRKHL